MFANPKLNIGQFQLREGMHVADFGAGTGFHTMEASRRVGNTGKVYAIEIQKDMVKRLESELRESGIKNVICVWGDVEKSGSTKVADESMDAIIISNLLFHASDKLGLIDEAKRILKKDGKVLVIDWKDSYENMGPAVQYVVKEDVAKEIFHKRGFRLLENISVSPHHYGIIFKHE